MARDNSQGTQTAGGNNGQNRRGSGSGSGSGGGGGGGGGRRRRDNRGQAQRWHGGVGVRRHRPRNNNNRPRNNNGPQRDRGHEQRLINQGILPEVEQIAFSATTNQSGQVTSAIAVNASRHGGRQVNVQARVDSIATGSRAVITNSGSALGTVADTVMAETGAPSVFAFVMPMNVAVFREQAIQSNTSTHRMFLGDSRIMAPLVSRPALPAPASGAPAVGSIQRHRERHRERQARQNRRVTQGPLNPEAASFIPGRGSVAETGAPSVFASVRPMNVAVFRDQAVQPSTTMHRMLMGDSRIMTPLVSRPALPAPASGAPAVGSIQRYRERRRARQNRRVTQRPLNPEAPSIVPETGSMAETGAPSVFASMNVAVFREQATQSSTMMHRMLMGDSRIMSPLVESAPSPAAENLRRRRERQARYSRRVTQGPLNPEAPSIVPATGSTAVAAVDNGPAPANTDAAMDNGPASANTDAAMDNGPASANTDAAVDNGPAFANTDAAVDNGPAPPANTDAAVDNGPAFANTDAAVDNGPAFANTDVAVDNGPAFANTDAAVDNGPASAANADAAVDNGPAPPANTDAGAGLYTGSAAQRIPGLQQAFEADLDKIGTEDEKAPKRAKKGEDGEDEGDVDVDEIVMSDVE
ncbi:hypothetical protein C2857_007413 [Epichloe festucae Fl1]|uniref:Uncharacterized protein n=1 Tax=Epichloe festucae (strain Fl1) TaxID=877507 RepID=A0A7S9KQR8_EPIFF|nr:hypothetical protein C2857_007413 [Epichloe festucae Fl1]